MKNNVYRRKQRAESAIDALTQAQSIVFAPLTFQAIAALLDLSILQSLDESNKTIQELIEELKLDDYTVRTLLEVADVSNIVKKVDGVKYSLTKTGKCFLRDDMTRINFEFIRNCCYLGASELTNSFVEKKPAGLQKFFEDSETIYPLLPRISDKFKNSWYDFDNYYSDNCFEIIEEIISNSNPDRVFDIGGNTGKFERVWMKSNPTKEITMIDLPENIEAVKDNKELAGCKFVPLNILDDSNGLPVLSGAVLMSQFLDCFSKEQICKILKKVKSASKDGTKIFILEPFTDNQNYEGAKLALTHTSLYFTCMANGYSKMYTLSEMKELISESGLELNEIHENIGMYDYTLLECEING